MALCNAAALTGCRVATAAALDARSKIAAVPVQKRPAQARCAAQRQSRLTVASAGDESVIAAAGRRQALAATVAAAVFGPSVLLDVAQAKVPSGFNAVKDTAKGFAFIYPVGWQEYTGDGQEKVFKDVIEQLESVSLNVTATQRASLEEAGSPDEVAKTLVESARSPTTAVELISSTQRKDENGTVYYTFEFTSATKKAKRHAISSVAISKGKVFTLTTGASEPRWSKMKERLQTVADSFTVFGY